MKRVARRILFIVLATCVLPVWAQNKSDLNWSKTITRQTGSITQEFGLTDKNEFARLVVQAKVESGRIAWRLKDPNGEVRLTGQVTDGNGRGDSGRLEAIAGQWTLDIDMENATGNYKINWTSR